MLPPSQLTWNSRSCYTIFSVHAIVVPFEEDDKDPSIWFLDHNYHEAMFGMFKRINGMYSKYLMLTPHTGICYLLTSRLIIMFGTHTSQGACCWMVQHWPKAAGK